MSILLGALSLVIAFIFDWASWLRLPRIKPLLGVGVCITFFGALAWTLADSQRLPWPRWLTLAGWPLFILSGALLIWSLFIEIPFVATYARQGVGNTLVKTGTYALVRHPGVIWYALWLLALALISRGRLMLAAAVIWSVLNALYVWLQEVFLFSKMFPGYPAYQKETPMLVPTRQSAARCLQTIGRRPHTASS